MIQRNVLQLLHFFLVPRYRLVAERVIQFMNGISDFVLRTRSCITYLACITKNATILADGGTIREK